jgi:Holliday junction resolvasome RuvABC DNA-binding subunit
LVDLQDKMGKDPAFVTSSESAQPRLGQNEFAGADNTKRSDALGALCNLGFDRKRVETVLDQLAAEGVDTVEEFVRAALKRL